VDKMYYACALLLFVTYVSALAPLLRTAKPIQDSYIVVFHTNTSVQQAADALSFFEQTHGVEFEHTYQHTIKGFSAKLTIQQLLEVRVHSAVDFVEQDQTVKLAQTCPTQTGADWGLARICKRPLNLDGRFTYPSNQGSGIDAYVIDTGILISHTEFSGGRALWGYKANNGWPSTDDQGHGTHVASTVGGRLYGVAKQVTLIAVKVLSGDGSGTTAGVIAGVDWSAGSRRSRGRPSVGNMSLGGGRSTALNNACNAASDAGVLMVVAAGNDNNNACNGSPASATRVISVGATDRTDSRSSFSNYGTCVHVFAPGSDILGAWIGSNSATRRISGTSMASPHICGISALGVGGNRGWGFAQLKSWIQGQATQDALNLRCSNTACNQSPNLLGYVPCF